MWPTADSSLAAGWRDSPRAAPCAGRWFEKLKFEFGSGRWEVQAFETTSKQFEPSFILYLYVRILCNGPVNGRGDERETVAIRGRLGHRGRD